MSGTSRRSGQGRDGGPLRAVAAFVTGPRGRWLTIAVWIVLGVAGLLARSQIDEVTAAGRAATCPPTPNRPGPSLRCSAATVPATRCRP